MTHAQIGNPNFFRRDDCPGCRSTEHDTIYQCGFTQSPIRKHIDACHLPDVEDASYTLMECRRCGLIFQQDIANPELMQRLYDGPRGQKTKGGSTLDRRYRYAYEIIRVVRYLGLPPEELSILDYGMGWGEWISVAQALGCDSYGFDIAARRSAFAEKIGVQVLNKNEMSAHEFDFINTEQVFEHLPNPLETLRELKNILKPSGVIKISVPNGRRFKRVIDHVDRLTGSEIKPALPLFHINCFTRSCIVSMAKSEGMEEVFPPFIRLNRRKIMNGPVTTLYRRFRHKIKDETYLFFRKTR